MLVAIQNGWQPPTRVTPEDHALWRKRAAKSNSPMVAFVGHGCCFGGVFFGGYARHVRNQTDPAIAEVARSSILKQKPKLEGVDFKVRDYREGYWGMGHLDLAYMDPPYANTSPVGTKDTFDHDEFWKFCERLVKGGTAVLVSEYSCPLKQARVVWQKTYLKSLRSADGVKHKTEKLYCLSPQVKTQIGFGF